MPGDVSIHAFRGEGDRGRTYFGMISEVSIHAFRGEGDVGERMYVYMDKTFQSTPSGGKATKPCNADTCAHVVSIHAFRGEGDSRNTSMEQ